MAEAGLNEQQMQLVAQLEMEMMQDMYSRMTNTCHRKCINVRYSEADLSKGESICLDRCVAKYLDIHDRIGKKLTSMSGSDEELLKKAQAPGGVIGGIGG